MLDEHRARLAAAGDDVDHARRQARLGHDLGEEQGGQAGVRSRLEHNGVAHRNRRGDLPRQHQQREIPRDDLPDHADRLVVAQFGFHQLRPARIIVKVTGEQRHVDIARFADRLAVVHGFEHRQQAVMFLNVAGDGIQITGTHNARGLAPRPERRTCRGDSRIDFFLSRLHGLGQQFAIGRVVDRVDISRPSGVTHSLLMNKPKLRPCSSSQALTASGASGAGPYSMLLKISSNLLIILLQFVRDPCIAFTADLAHRHVMPRGVVAGDVVIHLPFEVGQQAAGADAEQIRH